MMSKQLILSGLLLLAACTTQPLNSRNPEQVAALQRYLQQATHLSAEQRTAMQQGQPFIGMTLAEADLAMERVKESEQRLGEQIKLVYHTGGANYYTVFFAGHEPSRIVEYLFMSDRDLEQLWRDRDLPTRARPSVF